MLDFAKYMESILHLFEYMIIYYIFSQIFEKRFKSPYVGYSVILILIFINVSTELVLGLVSIQSFFIKLAMLFATLRILFKGRLRNIFLLFILNFIVITICDVIVISAATFLFKMKSFEFMLVGLNRLVLGVTSRILFLVAGQLIIARFRNVSSMNMRNLYQLVMILLINSAFIILAGDLYFQSKSALSSDIDFILGIMIGIMIFSFLTVHITESIVSYSKKERDWQLQEEEYRRQTFYINHLNDLNQQMKAIRHDFNHHIGCIHGMLEHGDMNAARSYADELVSNAEQFNVAFSTRHAGISGLLSTKFEVMKQAGIPFVWSVELPEDLKVKLIDVSIILGNALDNAIEANEHVDVKERLIDLKIYEEMDNIIIKIRNAYEAAHASPELETTKHDSENHGYGLKNIRFVVDKYDGLFHIERGSAYFTLNVALPNVM